MLWAGLRERDPRHDRVRPLAVHRPMKEPDRRFARGVGRHLLAPARPATDLDRSAQPWHGLTDVARGWRQRPAQLAGLTPRDRIAVGCDADFCVLAPDESFAVDPGRLHHRHPITPYAVAC